MRNAATIILFLVIAKLFAVSRELVIAWRYGVSGIVDAFNISFTVITWAPQLFTSIMIISLVPHLVVSNPTPEHRRLLSELNGAVLAGSVVLFGITLAAGPWIAAEIAGDLGTSTIMIVQEMVAGMAPFALLLMMSGYLGVRLQARQRFGYTLSEALPPLVLSLFVIMAPSPMIYRPLIWGLLLGGVLQLGILLRLIGRRDGGLGSIRLGFTASQWRTIWLALGMIALGQILTSLSIPIDQVLAAKLGPGAVAIMGYSNRLMGLVTSMVLAVVGYSLLPILSAVAARGDHWAGRSNTIKAATVVFVLGVVGSLIAWLAAHAGIALIFQRGAFTAADAESVAAMFRLSALQLPFFASGIALMQWLAATKRHGSICLILFIAAIGRLASALWLSQLFGLAGIAMAQVVMYFLFFVGMLVLVVTGHGKPGRHDGQAHRAMPPKEPSCQSGV